MLTKHTKLPSFPGPFQYSVTKEFLFTRWESLGTRLHKASYTRRNHETVLKEAKVIHADSCKHRQAPAYTKSSE